MAERELRKQKISIKRHEQILNAATEIFVQKGYTDATIPEIAKLSGLATGTIYIYYPSKRELFTAVIERLVVTPTLSIFTNKAGNDFASTLKEVIRDRVGLLQKNTMPQLLALIGEIRRDEQAHTILAEKLVKPFLAKMEKMYCNRLESGEIRRMQPELIVRIIGSIMIGMTILENIEGESSPLNHLSQEQIADEICNLILYGLMKSGSRDAK